MIYLGTVNWRYPHWVRSFYPDDDVDSWLSYYSKKSSFAEIKSTYTKWLSPRIISKWYSDTSNSFIFSAYMYKKITQNPENKIDETLLNKFFDNLKPLGEKLGLVLLSFSNKFQYSAPSLAFITQVLDSIKSKFDGALALELGNRSWYNEEINQLLLQYDACLVSSDKKPVTSNMKNPDLYYLKLSGDTRLVPAKDFGKNYFPRDNDIKQWANHLKFKYKRYRKIFVSIDNHFSGDATKDAYMLANALKSSKIKLIGFTDR